jgi:hypothetical protein
MFRKIVKSITTAADQTLTDYAGNAITGRVHAVKYEYGDLAATTDITLVGATTGVPILTLTDLAQSNQWFYPRAPAHTAAAGAAITDSAEPIMLHNEKIKITVAQGGASKTGTLTFFIEDDVSA